MGMGIVSDDEFEKELKKYNNGEVREIQKGRGVGNIEVPNSLRQIIGETNELDSRKEALEIAKEFGIKPSSVSAYAVGATSTASYDTPKEQNVNHINQSRARIAGKARNRLLLALNHITEEKLANAKVQDLASVAKNMSSIVKDLEPTTINEVNQPTFVLYSPQYVKEETFDVVFTKE